MITFQETMPIYNFSDPKFQGRFLGLLGIQLPWEKWQKLKAAGQGFME